MVTHYRSRSKGLTPIAKMHDEHLARTIANPAPGTDAATMDALKAEQARRAGNPAPAPSSARKVSGSEAYRKVFGG